ncbi:MAG: hypothetical protein AAF986_05550 [Pseudomonadota bacterium]
MTCAIPEEVFRARIEQRPVCTPTSRTAPVTAAGQVNDKLIISQPFKADIFVMRTPQAVNCNCALSFFYKADSDGI